jgi:hypothetical protein
MRKRLAAHGKPDSASPPTPVKSSRVRGVTGGRVEYAPVHHVTNLTEASRAERREFEIRFRPEPNP